MTNKKFVEILIENIYENDKKMYRELFKNKEYSEKFQYILNKLNEEDRNEIFSMIDLVIQNTISATLSIIDQWGGGYFNDGKDNDGHFELYYVSNEKGKYKYRVDEDSTDIFLSKIE